MVETQTGVAAPSKRRDIERLGAGPIVHRDGPTVPAPFFPPDPYKDVPRRRAANSARWLNRSEAAVLTIGLACTMTVCCLLVVYLAAYARVDQLGINQSALRARLRQDKMDNEILRAEYASLLNPNRIAAGAQALKMVRGAQRVVYIRGAQGSLPVVAANGRTDTYPSGTLPKTITQVSTITAAGDHSAPGAINGGIDTQTNHISITAD